MCSFIWEYTPQGHEYWSEISKRNIKIYFDEETKKLIKEALLTERFRIFSL